MQCPKCHWRLPPLAMECRCGYSLQNGRGLFSSLQNKWRVERIDAILGILIIIAAPIYWQLKVTGFKPGIFFWLTVCTAAALMAIYKTFLYLYQKKKVISWPSTMGKVHVTLGLNGSIFKDSFSSAPRIVYEYSVDGVTYRSDRVRFENRMFRKWRKSHVFANRFRKDEEIPVFYNPKKPWDSVLVKE